MVELACEGDPLLEASRLEEGSEYSYSIQTIRRMRERLEPGEEMFFLIGADAFAEIDTWHRWREVIGAVDFIVVSRPGHDYAMPEGAKVHRLETLALTTSSSDIRARLAAGDEDVDLPAAVLEYIRENRLYRPT
jgi:nicotinate-nucleotide adenylyltransferase